MVVLNNECTTIVSFIWSGVDAFLSENPGVLPQQVALYSSPLNGWVSLCIDVDDSNTVKAPKTNCPDFSHVEYRLLECPMWSAEYVSEHPFIQGHDGEVERYNPKDGDEAFNRPFYLLMMKVCNDYYHPGNPVFRPIWAGVQILDSGMASFWRVKDGQGA